MLVVVLGTGSCCAVGTSTVVVVLLVVWYPGLYGGNTVIPGSTSESVVVLVQYR
jgi:hypothetical protein